MIHPGPVCPPDCPRCEDIAEDRADPYVSSLEAEHFARADADRYERALWGDA